MAKIIYTGETDRTRGLFKHYLYDELPAHLAELTKDNPALAAQFENFEVFARRRPPGARIRRAVTRPVVVVPAHPPIRRK